MVCEGHHIERAPDRTGTERDAIVFELRALEAVVEKVEAEPPPPGVTLEELRRLAFAAATAPSQAPSQGKRNVYQRSQDVRNYVLARANGKCEGCGTAAPFLRSDGTPYLEPHHLRRVSDGGPDHPAHVIALCPNCHRRVHVGADGGTYNATLNESMATIEPDRFARGAHHPRATGASSTCDRPRRDTRYGYHEDRTPTHGYEASREAAMAAFAKSWRRE